MSNTFWKLYSGGLMTNRGSENRNDATMLRRRFFKILLNISQGTFCLKNERNCKIMKNEGLKLKSIIKILNSQLVLKN